MNTVFYLLAAVVISALFLLEVWTRYLAIMALYRVERLGDLPAVSRRLGLLLLGYGYLIDFLGNLLLTVLFLDLPRELLMTHRLQRYVDGPNGWRRRFALWVAVDMLDPFDPKGFHIRQPKPEAFPTQQPPSGGFFTPNE